ncbi:uncharacterized protein LOC122035229 [Zingiber officinale]|uniref:uncharacterized protein LOC122035229 n=1 Tax=Zingiber officinale TaxID=94328 RepID=UPI001C4C4FDC|nr:uncharacterized protein LOC122035229 [Zingiber officinale]
MEAISTLIYAAARFSDLPELRDLRSLFTERYGNCLESSVNAEFAEKTNRKSFSREWKLKVMQEIAEELSVSWTGERNQESRNLPSPKSAGQAQTKLDEQNEEWLDEHRVEMEARLEAFDLQTIAPPESSTESREKPRRNHDVGRKFEVLESIQEEDIDPAKPLKAKPVGRNELGKSGNRRVREKRRQGMGATDELENQPVALLKINPPYVTKLNSMNNAPKKLDGDSDTEKPKPFSVRKVLRKSPVNDTKDDNAVDKGQYRRKNAEAIQDERDDEEKILDDLLLYYSRKGTDKGTTQSRAPTKLEGRIQLPPPPTRTSSWSPSESVSPAETREPGRVSSLRSDPTSRLSRSLVHPRLPDYDQLAARFGALKNG